MHITQSQKSGKHSISNLTDGDLVMLHQSLVNKGYDAQKLADKIEQHLIECQDEEKIQEEYGYSVEEYVRRILDPKCPNLVDEEYKENWINYESNKLMKDKIEPVVNKVSEVVEETKFTANLEKDALDRQQLLIKGKHDIGGHQQINILMEEIKISDIDSLIKQLEAIKDKLS